MIRFVERAAIEDKRWNGVVHFALNNMPYGYTWYLDNVAESWDGLIWGDYEMVMPLVHHKKFGINYLYQPFFTQQLGVFSDKTPKPATVQKFLDAIPEEYKFIEINLNFLNTAKDESFSLTERTNLILDLENPYEIIAANYSESLKRNLKKARQQNLTVQNNISPEKFVAFYIANTGNKVKGLNEKHTHILHRIIYNALHYSMGSLMAVYDEHNELIAANFFIHSKSRVINLLPASNEKGKEKQAMSLLLDTAIQQYQNKPFLLDFEGSMIEGVARFYKSFGATEQNYFHLRRNTLPWYAKLLKH